MDAINVDLADLWPFLRITVTEREIRQNTPPMWTFCRTPKKKQKKK